MSETTVYISECLQIDWIPLHQGTAAFKISVTSSPSVEEAEKIHVIMRTWCENTKERFVFDIEHVKDAPEIKVQMPILVFSATKLFENKKIIQSRCLGTCIKGQVLDDHTKFCRDMFLSLYNPTRPFLLTDSSTEQSKFVDKCTRSSNN